VEASGDRALVVWEDGMGFESEALLDAAGDPVAHVGEVIHGGGGYFGDREHIESLAVEEVPERCIPAGSDDGFALIYDVEADPFE
jgi:hypothetical protein